MLVRLAFAIAIQVDAEILLIDEVLAVGDAAFQQKCFDEFFRLKREGSTIVFVSHDMYSIERFCDRAMLIEHGGMTQHRRTRVRSARGLPRAQLRPARPRGARRRRDCRQRAPRSSTPGSRTPAASASQASSQEERLVLCFEVRFGEDLDEPVFARDPAQPSSAHTIIVARSDQTRWPKRPLRGGRNGDRPLRAAQLARARAATRSPLRSRARARARTRSPWSKT